MNLYLRCLASLYMGLDSVVSIVTRYGLDGPEIEIGWVRDFT